MSEEHTQADESILHVIENERGVVLVKGTVKCKSVCFSVCHYRETLSFSQVKKAAFDRLVDSDMGQAGLSFKTDL